MGENYLQSQRVLRLWPAPVLCDVTITATSHAQLKSEWLESALRVRAGAYIPIRCKLLLPQTQFERS